jgi:hypothetical protein
MAAKPFASGHVLAAADVNDLVGLLDRSTSSVDVVSTTTATSIYDLAVAAAAMSTNRILRLTILGDYLNNNATATFILRIRDTVAGVLLNQTSNSIGTSADRRPFRIVIEIQNLGVTNSQLISAHVQLGGVGGSGIIGIGNMATAPNSEILNHVIGSTATLDTTVARTLQVTIEHNASSANQSFRKRAAWAELL